MKLQTPKSFIIISVCCFSVLLVNCKKNDNNNSKTTNTSDCNHLISIDDADSTVIALPTAFSPNGDGINDVYRPIIPYPTKISSFSLSIFKQDGSLVYQANSTTQFGWDGIDKNGIKSTDYKYQVQVSFVNASGIKIDTCTYLYLLRNSSSGCLNDVAADKANYYFLDQFDPATAKPIYATYDILCN